MVLSTLSQLSTLCGRLQVLLLSPLFNLFTCQYFAEKVEQWLLGMIYCIVLYCIAGVVIAAQCIATCLRFTVPPRIWVLGCEYAN